MTYGIQNTLDLISGFLPEMASNGGGSIVVTSSMASIEANPLLGAYGAAKATPNSIVRNTAAERAPHNIRANTIAPGIVRTGCSQALWQDGRTRAGSAQRSHSDALPNPTKSSGPPRCSVHQQKPTAPAPP
ncbi:SDR family NAD(P)-dependent oxidoreductase [Arthrobacter sp. NPDC080073]|uniref:SDR family NAD(P)-dependent oxidoreductase n=1 Tax=Arthrobacter sp. NPDC080073 TaxID=3155919 RepID=UPI00343DB151